MPPSGSVSGGRVVAVLGPTNTGKTHTAVERMLGHVDGMIGFPLRLLAREVYDKVVAVKGRTRVALITGEEKIVPERPAYYICTAEAMPLEKDVAFLAVDEIQMCADYQRGHIFTERLLRARGRSETQFLGSDTIRPLIRALVPEAEIISRPRLSKLSYVKPKKLSRLPPRTAVVAFTANDVYAAAELLRRRKGGAAIVMGALSPRTRNAQVALYQSGEVDYLVATDAIGMGLNMDIDHVVFADTRKFDGRLQRSLYPAELAQIAGRAGRHLNDGTFSVLAGGATKGGNGGAGSGNGLDAQLVAQIEDHNFEPLKVLMWRNPRLAFGTPRDLLRSLEAMPTQEGLARAPEAEDEAILRMLVADPDIAAQASGREGVRRLWEACQIPDFRKVSLEDHARLVGRIFGYRMSDSGTIPNDWIASMVSRLENVNGDIDTLAARIAGVRVWTYVAHRRGWLAEREHWTHVTRALEDKLSDALHARLMQRFVDRRTAVLMRELRQGDEFFVTVGKDGAVSVEDHVIGHLKGFSFVPDDPADADARRLLNSAAEKSLTREIRRRVDVFLGAGPDALELRIREGTPGADILWDGVAIASLQKGSAPLRPRLRMTDDTLLGSEDGARVQAHLEAWLANHVSEVLRPLHLLDAELSGASKKPAPPSEGEQAPPAEDKAGEPGSADDPGAAAAAAPPAPPAPLSGLARGVAFRLAEQMGVLPRSAVDKDLRQIDQEARKSLRRFGVRIGAGSLFIPALLKPKPTELRLLLWALYGDREVLPPMPTPGMVWVEMAPTVPAEFYTLAGFRAAGGKAVRVDMLERLADAVRPLGQDGASFEVSPEIMGLVGLSGDDFVAVMRAIGYRRDAPPPAAAKVPEQGDGKEGDAMAGDKPEPSNEAEAPAADKAAAGAPEGKNADAPPAERLFFRWQPARPERRRQARKGDGATPGGTKSAKRPAKGQRKARGGSGKAGKTARAGNGRPRHKAPGAAAAAREPDPDSPFAALQGLREAMMTQTKQRPAKRRGKKGQSGTNG